MSISTNPLNVFLDWYKASYGEHAQRLINVEKKKDDDEDDFENMFKSEETALKQQGGQNDNQQLQDSKSLLSFYFNFLSSRLHVSDPIGVTQCIFHYPLQIKEITNSSLQYFLSLNNFSLCFIMSVMYFVLS